MRTMLISLVAAVLAGLLAAAAIAAPAKDVYIFKGDPMSKDNISVGAWGSGKATESKEQILNGSVSVKITTQGYYAGGSIEFADPVPLFTDGLDKKQYMVLSVFFPDIQTIDPAAGTNDAFDVDAYTMPQMKSIRLVLISDSGVMGATVHPTDEPDSDDGWVRIGIPLAKLRLPEDMAEFRLKKLLIFGDRPGTMYLGEIRLVIDNEPIKVDSLGSKILGIMDNVFLVAEARGGASNLRYSWDFDQTNGIQSEAAGKVGHYVYTRGGDFTITLTVSDADGLKAPVTSKATITIID